MASTLTPGLGSSSPPGGKGGSAELRLLYQTDRRISTEAASRDFSRHVEASIQIRAGQGRSKRAVELTLAGEW